MDDIDTDEVAATATQDAREDASAADAPVVGPAPSSAAGHDFVALIERWFQDEMPGSPVASSTAVWNHVSNAKERLKQIFAAL